MKIDNHIGESIVDYFRSGSEEITDPVLSQWCAESEDNRRELAKYKKIWIMTNIFPSGDEFDVGAAWKNVDAVNKRKYRNGRKLKKIGYAGAGIAAAAILVAAILFWGPFGPGGRYETMYTATGYGNRSEAILPDGSKVMLNAGSTLGFRYDKRQKRREVEFSGEAFFEVYSNDTPFEVTVPGKVRVIVTGTKFNLTAYPEENRVRTTLFEGSVELQSEKSSVSLSVGQEAAFDRKEGMFAVSSDISQACGWMEQKLYMDDTSLAEICRTLERWYDVGITVPSELGEEIRYTGVIQENSVTEILDAMRLLSGIGYTVDGNSITITAK